MIHTIHKSLEELLSSVIPWPEIGSNSGHWPRLYSFGLDCIKILSAL